MKNLSVIISFLLCITSYAQMKNHPAATLSDAPVFSQAYVGMKVVRGDGEVIMASNEDKMLVPASNMKLISTGAALFSLGPDYRFSTDLAYDGHISDGVLHGDLYIVGGGDPTLGSKDSLSSALPEVFKQWKDAVVRAGIKRIEGRIIGDGRWLEGMGADPTWQWGDLGTYYGAGVTGLMFYENMISFFVSAGSGVGKPVDIKPSYPSCSWMDFRYTCTTGDNGTGDRLYMYASEFEPVAEIRGTFGADRSPKRIDCSNNFPEYTCAVYFKNYLNQNGITCTGGAADFKLKRDWVAGQIPAYGIGAHGGSLKTIGSFSSPELSRIAFKTNHESNNLFAETLFRTLGKENIGSSCSDSSYIAIQDILKKMHVGHTGISMQDGSGLSRHNLISADFMCRFLGAMMDSPCFKEYLCSLPVPGGNGTLKYNMKGVSDSTKVRFRVKSGSMNGIRCYSGYILPEGYIPEAGKDVPQDIKDKTIIFSILTNNCTSPSGNVRGELDRLMVELAGF